MTFTDLKNTLFYIPLTVNEAIIINKQTMQYWPFNKAHSKWGARGYTWQALCFCMAHNAFYNDNSDKFTT